jgi:hypothetical protein
MNTRANPFWPEFAAAHWGQRPAVFNDAPGLPLASPAEVFSALRAASDRFRAGDPSEEGVGTLLSQLRSLRGFEEAGQ